MEKCDDSSYPKKIGHTDTELSVQSNNRELKRVGVQALFRSFISAEETFKPSGKLARSLSPSLPPPSLSLSLRSPF
ncbi:hypothetical protein J6590_015296 [Homalodisca vitripennis]|nr:hypothetical protein J6590_015296 [Homalodisca vitripennis]